ncbi:hypothetical protein CLAIMM_01283, partial [Cladophialophora immunda]
MSHQGLTECRARVSRRREYSSGQEHGRARGRRRSRNVRRMPHDFLLLFGSSPGGQDCLNRWTAVLRASTTPEAKTQRPEKSASAFVRSTKGTWREVGISQIQPHRTTKELITGMEEMI